MRKRCAKWIDWDAASYRQSVSGMGLGETRCLRMPVRNCHHSAPAETCLQLVPHQLLLQQSAAAATMLCYELAPSRATSAATKRCVRCHQKPRSQEQLAPEKIIINTSSRTFNHEPMNVCSCYSVAVDAILGAAHPISRRKLPPSLTFLFLSGCNADLSRTPVQGAVLGHVLSVL
jgi:hypothetical protein